MLGNEAFAVTAFSEEAVQTFPSVTVRITGVSASAVVGNLPVTPVGVEATTAVNGVTLITDQNIEVTGVEARGINNGIRQDALVVITTVDAEGWGRSGWAAGSWGVALQTNVEATTAVGDAEAIPVTYGYAEGVEVTGEITGVDVYPGTGIVVPVTGLEATGIVSFRGAKVWGRIIPDVDNTWIRVAPNATNEYTEIRP
jgi:hypothetical protein